MISQEPYCFTEPLFVGCNISALEDPDYSETVFTFIKPHIKNEIDIDNTELITTAFSPKRFDFFNNAHMMAEVINQGRRKSYTPSSPSFSAII